MTVLAGILGVGDPESTRRHCISSIAAQWRFSAGRPFVQTASTATLSSDAGGQAHHFLFASPNLLLVADVRLDNRESLAAELTVTSADLSSLSDSDLLLLAWSRWGDESLSRIGGSFAFVVHDRERRATWLVRDPLGERPLSFSIRGHRLAFASMPIGIWPGERPEPHLPTLANQLRGQRLPPDRSIYKGIQRVAPGHLVEFRAGQIRTLSYWKPARSSLPPNGGLAAAFRETLEKAVLSRLGGGTEPRATMLSSGFDSSAVTGTLARVVDRPELVTAYTSAPAAMQMLLCPRGRIADESRLAAETAKMLKIGHRVIRDSSPILCSLHGLSSYFQAPAPNPFNLGWWRSILDDARQSGVSTIAVASRGNFTISFGGIAVLPSWLRSGRFWKWFSETRSAVRSQEFVRWRGALFASAEPWLPSNAIRPLERIFRRAPPPDHFDFVNRAMGRGSVPTFPFRPSGDLVADRLSLLALHDEGERVKGMTALTGVEERDPTADFRVIEFCLALRAEHLLSNGRSRPLAQEAFRDRMTIAAQEGRQRGYQGADWYARLHKSEAEEIVALLGQSSAAELLDLPKISAAISGWPEFDSRRQAELFAFGRGLSAALSYGLFVAETERSDIEVESGNPDSRSASAR
jgi:asparagine synthase (glutamine-hydrolysing)